MHQEPILQFLGFSVYLYGLMIAIGILCCFLVLFSYSKKMNLSPYYVDFTFYNGIFSIAVGFFGSALWQAVFNYIDDVKSGISNPTFSLNGGITAIGGIASGAVTFIIVCLFFRKRYPFVISRVARIAPCCIIIAHAFGRLGCFFAGCCYGRAVQEGDLLGFLGVCFPEGSLHNFPTGYYTGTPVYPTQLFESIFLFLLFGTLTYLCLKRKFKFAMPVYLISYGVWRFLIEYVRADYRGSFVGSLTPSQGQSIILIVLGVVAIFISRYYNKKEDIYNQNLLNQEQQEIRS